MPSALWRPTRPNSSSHLMAQPGASRAGFSEKFTSPLRMNLPHLAAPFSAHARPHRVASSTKGDDHDENAIVNFRQEPPYFCLPERAAEVAACIAR
jgi:hypothetical protein